MVAELTGRAGASARRLSYARASPHRRRFRRRSPESFMAQTAFSFPRQWQDWCSWGLGIWLVLSPWALFFDQERLAMENAVVVGALILVAEVVELSIFRDWEEWINVVLGAWLAISPWVLKLASASATWNFVVVGTLVVVLAVYEIREMGSTG
jgi:SPW repeat